MQDRAGISWKALMIWGVVALGSVWLGYRFILQPQPDDAPPQNFSEMTSTGIITAPGGHAYQYVVAPNLSWERSRDEAAKKTFKGRKGYLATIVSVDEKRFILDKVFGGERSNVTYLGGRQTARGEWRWVTGPEGAADGGKGLLFWTGDERGEAQNGHQPDWMFTAFQHGGKWDANLVCCVTLFSYRLPQFSTSLGNGDPEEGVAGYLVEFGE